ncbi:MAG: S8 family serine peptidase, partial [Pseudomonadota bacterium]
MVKALYALAMLVVAGSVHALEPQIVERTQPSVVFEDVTTDATVRGQTRTYIVQMRDEAGLVYEGGLSGFLATAPQAGQRYDANASHVQQYTAHLINTHDAALNALGAADRKVYDYCHTMNGFAASLTPAEAAALKANENVVQVWEDYAYEINTNDTSEFLGLNDRREGLRARGNLKGENIIIGVMDTGAIPENPSFSDKGTFEVPKMCDNPNITNPHRIRACEAIAELNETVQYDAPPERWTGICEAGEGWSEDDCNNKLIGARWYVDGFLAGRGSVVEG